MGQQRCLGDEKIKTMFESRQFESVTWEVWLRWRSKGSLTICKAKRVERQGVWELRSRRISRQT